MRVYYLELVARLWNFESKQLQNITDGKVVSFVSYFIKRHRSVSKQIRMDCTSNSFKQCLT